MISQENLEIFSLINSLVDGLMIFDREGRLILINLAAQNIFEVKESEILYRPISDFLNFSKLRYLFYLLGDEIKEVSKKELKIDEDLILEVTSLPIFFKNKGKLVILRNITREKVIERMKAEFVSISAHQLRTPIAGIKWALEILLREELSQDQRKLLQDCYSALQRLIVLIDNLLKIVSIEEGKYLANFTSTDIEKLIDKIIANYREKITKKRIKLSFEKEGEIPKIMVDSEKILLVLENLLGNAINYTPEGGIVQISLKKTSDELVFSVSDSGIGIPENQQGNVFQKFFRASNAIKVEPDGSGLGLFISKNIIEAHGGKIGFKSQENQGSTFYFSLPLKWKKEF
jgi:signal transduction histidine kinase